MEKDKTESSKLLLAKNAPSTLPHQDRRRVSLRDIGNVVVLVLSLILIQTYLFPSSNESSLVLTASQIDHFQARLQKCVDDRTEPVTYPPTHAGSRTNPRWNPKTGQNQTVLLKNATLFDGEKILDTPVDILFKNGVIVTISPTSKSVPSSSDLSEYTIQDLGGKYVTPGLVDMHSHHLAFAWPYIGSAATSDTNEVNDATGPLTPQVRVVDSIKAYDVATTIIASGGVTTSLILPGSANIMGGEAVVVKNLLASGADGEKVVEEILLEHGIPKNERRRYMKMACGENPRRTYRHTRMGNAWIFRKHMTRAKELMEKQDAWCEKATILEDDGDMAAISKFVDESSNDESATDYLEYDSSIGMLRGQVGVNIHCYESEDFEDMISHSKEFGFRIQAFHHGLDAWEVPEMIKASGQQVLNITIATFAEMGFYKKEAYDANLWAGKILANHGVPVAYKSDHVDEETNAKYLLFQAATGHAFHLPEDLALQSVTSVPAKSVGIDHRVGYAREGYDADLVIWNSHPLLVGATPLQVYIDGRATLDPKTVAEAGVLSQDHGARSPIMKKVLTASEKENICGEVEKPGVRVTVTGIRKSYLHEHDEVEGMDEGNLTMIVEAGKILCFGSSQKCLSESSEAGPTINLQNGYLSPGLKAVSVSLGLSEITMEDTSADGSISKTYSLDAENVVYAKYGIHLEGRGFVRAKLAGVTRAITAPISSGFVGGVSTGIETSGKYSILEGGIFQDDVALHFAIGQGAKAADSLPTISSEIQKLRQILNENKLKDNIYGKAANGSIPLVVHVENEYDIQQLIRVKQQYNQTNLVIFGGSGAHLVAKDLARANIPVILTANRGAPDRFEKRNALPGPPLTKFPAAVLTDAGVKFGLAIAGESDSHIHNLPLEASWAAKFSGLSGKQAIDLVSQNIEDILGLECAEDMVLYEGDPLELGASVVLAFEGLNNEGDEGVNGKGGISMCWPEGM
ncbi:hypothetical protein HYFRA_00001887 [Hymenoscyphus fraxineus]|uniref:Amidohydrolase-related domain-containing protein n=1 Tax=Hymenoscyphus fraxineus TaxID=746836 RepID=A0A9N9KMN1_9HELO|nr:hypothetical protein HYFRA_00001887 [Hymenoscyphus fraxineus]